MTDAMPLNSSRPSFANLRVGDTLSALKLPPVSLLTLALPNGAPFLAAANPVRFTGEPPAPAQPAPRLDEHRSALLRELGL